MIAKGVQKHLGAGVSHIFKSSTTRAIEKGFVHAASHLFSKVSILPSLVRKRAEKEVLKEETKSSGGTSSGFSQELGPDSTSLVIHGVEFGWSMFLQFLSVFSVIFLLLYMLNWFLDSVEPVLLSLLNWLHERELPFKNILGRRIGRILGFVLNLFKCVILAFIRFVYLVILWRRVLVFLAVFSVVLIFLTENLTDSIGALIGLSNFSVGMCNYLFSLLNMFSGFFEVSRETYNATGKSAFVLYDTAFQNLWQNQQAFVNAFSSSNMLSGLVNSIPGGRRLGGSVFSTGDSFSRDLGAATGGLGPAEFADLETFKKIAKKAFGVMAFRSDLWLRIESTFLGITFQSVFLDLLGTLVLIEMDVFTVKIMCAFASLLCTVRELFGEILNIIDLGGLLICSSGELNGVSCQCAGYLLDPVSLGIFSGLLQNGQCAQETVLGSNRRLVHCDKDEHGFFSEYISDVLVHIDHREEIGCPNTRRLLDAQSSATFFYENKVYTLCVSGCVMNAGYEVCQAYTGEHSKVSTGHCGHSPVVRNEIHLLKNFTHLFPQEKKRRGNAHDRKFYRRNLYPVSKDEEDGDGPALKTPRHLSVKSLEDEFKGKAFEVESGHQCRVDKDPLTSFDLFYDAFCIGSQKLVHTVKRKLSMSDSNDATVELNVKRSRKKTSYEKDSVKDNTSPFRDMLRTMLNKARVMNSVADDRDMLEKLDIVAATDENDIGNIHVAGYARAFKAFEDLSANTQHHHRSLQTQAMIDTSVYLCSNGQYRCPDGSCQSDMSNCPYPKETTISGYLNQNLLNLQSTLTSVNPQSYYLFLHNCFQSQSQKPETDPLSYHNTMGNGDCSKCTYCPPFTIAPMSYAFGQCTFNLTDVIVGFCSQESIGNCLCTRYYADVFDYNSVLLDFIMTFTWHRFLNGLIWVLDFLWLFLYPVVWFLQAVWQFFAVLFNLPTNVVYAIDIYRIYPMSVSHVLFCWFLHSGNFFLLLLTVVLVILTVDPSMIIVEFLYVELTCSEGEPVPYGMGHLRDYHRDDHDSGGMAIWKSRPRRTRERPVFFKKMDGFLTRFHGNTTLFKRPHHKNKNSRHKS